MTDGHSALALLAQESPACHIRLSAFVTPAPKPIRESKAQQAEAAATLLRAPPTADLGSPLLWKAPTAGGASTMEGLNGVPVETEAGPRFATWACRLTSALLTNCTADPALRLFHKLALMRTQVWDVWEV